MKEWLNSFYFLLIKNDEILHCHVNPFLDLANGESCIGKSVLYFFVQVIVPFIITLFRLNLGYYFQLLTDNRNHIFNGF